MNESSKIVGREAEISVLKEALKSDQAELIANPRPLVDLNKIVWGDERLVSECF
jgi:hypothetical protein